jgi:hypothetical protein
MRAIVKKRLFRQQNAERIAARSGEARIPTRDCVANLSHLAGPQNGTELQNFRRLQGAVTNY